MGGINPAKSTSPPQTCLKVAVDVIRTEKMPLYAFLQQKVQGELLCHAAETAADIGIPRNAPDYVVLGAHCGAVIAS